MVDLTSKDYRSILQLVYDANHCDDIDSFIKTVLPSIAQMFNTECITFHLTEGYPRQVKVIESRSFKSDKQKLHEDTYFPTLYKDDYYQYSPLLKEALYSSKNVLKIGDSISFNDWERSDMYNRFILPQHLYWEIFLAFRRKHSLDGMITMWRGRQQPNFKEADISKAKIIVPHLMIAIHNIRLVSMINSRKERFISEGEAGGEGFLLLDHKLRLCYSNAKAAEICAQLTGRIRGTCETEKSDFPIPSYITKDCTELLGLLKITEQPTPWPKERLVFTKYGHRLRIECSLIWKYKHINSMCPYFLVSLTDLDKEHTQANTLQARFNISNRELDVVNLLVRGLSYNEIADKLFISKLTVHTHIKNIYKKLGTRSKIELIRNIQSPTWLT